MANAWMWVVVTDDPARQALAIEFINWMMDVARQREYAEVIFRLPSQEPALQSFNRSLLNAGLMDDLVSGLSIQHRKCRV
jgi:hypothetical protein